MTLRRLTWMKTYKPGDLVLVEVSTSGFTLCTPHGKYSGPLKEYTHTERSRHYISLGHRTALITQVITNRLNQPLVYEMLCENTSYSCKAILADKYLVMINHG